MNRTVSQLLEDAESELLQEAANPVVDEWKEGVLEKRQEKLEELIEVEKAKISAESDATLGGTAKDLALLSATLDRQNSIFGYRRGTNYYVAARLYAEGRSPGEISKQTGIPRREIGQLINHKLCGWRVQRDRMWDTIALELRRENLPVLKKLSQMGYTIIEKAFEERIRQSEDRKEPKAITLSEAVQVATIMGFIAKEKRLDEDTNLKAKEKSLTPTEIFKQFAEDPYFGPAFKQMVKDVIPIEVEVSSGSSGGDSADS